MFQVGVFKTLMFFYHALRWGVPPIARAMR